MVTEYIKSRSKVTDISLTVNLWSSLFKVKFESHKIMAACAGSLGLGHYEQGQHRWHKRLICQEPKSLCSSSTKIEPQQLHPEDLKVEAEKYP